MSKEMATHAKHLERGKHKSLQISSSVESKIPRVQREVPDKDHVLSGIEDGMKPMKMGLKEGKRLHKIDYEKDTIELARYLLGKLLLHKVENEVLIGRIVETEAYTGVSDPASHSYGGKCTERTKPMFMEAGTCYVYTIYGMYCCMNISSCDEGGAVLIRALEPLQGIHLMTQFRLEKRNTLKELKSHQLCNGPSKLCQALRINKTLSSLDMTKSDEFYIIENENENINEKDIVVCKRIGIDGYGEVAASHLYRFYVRDNKNVSKRDKMAEIALTEK